MQYKRLFLTITVLLSFSRMGFTQQSISLEHRSVVHTVAFSPVDASRLASGGDDHRFKSWNVQNQQRCAS